MQKTAYAAQVRRGVETHRLYEAPGKIRVMRKFDRRTNNRGCIADGAARYTCYAWIRDRALTDILAGYAADGWTIEKAPPALVRSHEAPAQCPDCGFCPGTGNHHPESPLGKSVLCPCTCHDRKEA